MAGGNAKPLGERVATIEANQVHMQDMLSDHATASKERSENIEKKLDAFIQSIIDTNKRVDEVEDARKKNLNFFSGVTATATVLWGALLGYIEWRHK